MQNEKTSKNWRGGVIGLSSVLAAPLYSSALLIWCKFSGTIHDFFGLSIWAPFHAIGPPLSPQGPRGLPAQPHQMDHWLSIVWGRAFLRAFLAESRSLLQPVESPFLSQYIFALSNPFSPSGYLYINAVRLFQDYLCVTLFFMVLSNPEHFYD